MKSCIPIGKTIRLPCCARLEGAGEADVVVSTQHVSTKMFWNKGFDTDIYVQLRIVKSGLRQFFQIEWGCRITTFTITTLSKMVLFTTLSITSLSMERRYAERRGVFFSPGLRYALEQTLQTCCLSFLWLLSCRRNLDIVRNDQWQPARTTNKLTRFIKVKKTV